MRPACINIRSYNYKTPIVKRLLIKGFNIIKVTENEVKTDDPMLCDHRLNSYIILIMTVTQVDPC